MRQSRIKGYATLGQSIILSTLFSSYGLGLWGDLDRFMAVLIAIVMTASLMVLLVVWRKRCALGPFEWVLRRMTYAWRQDEPRFSRQ